MKERRTISCEARRDHRAAERLDAQERSRSLYAVPGLRRVDRLSGPKHGV
jgi:hypothetical protein